MNLPGKRLLLGTAIAAAALGVGGVAYAAGNDPAPDQGYVTVEEGPSAGTPSTSPGDGTSAAPQGRDGRDCPDKNGSGQAQPEQTQPEQTQPEQSQSDPQSNA